MRLRRLVLTCLASATLGGGAFAGEAGEIQPISIETSDKPLETVLQWISRRAGVNIVCNEQDQPRITLRLTNVTWQDAVDQIARKYDFVIEKRNEKIWELTRPPKVRMEFQGAALGTILEALARQAGVNIVIGDEIDTKRKLSMTLNGVPWREALDVIVKSVGYAWVEQDYSIVRIVSKANVTKDLETRIIKVNNIPVTQKASGGSISFLELLAKQLEPGESVVGDERTNSLILSASRPSIEKVLRLIPQLDTQVRQVQIEMRFVDFSTAEAASKGFDVLQMSFDVAKFGSFALEALPTGSSIGYSRTSQGPAQTTRPSVGAIFSFLANLNSTQLIQAPQLLTLDNSPATLEIGEKQRFAELTVSVTDQGTVTRGLTEAKSSPVEDGVKLKVTPTITNDGFVQLKLDADNTKAVLTPYTAVDGASQLRISLPQTKQTKLVTNIIVKSGETAVLGGILSNNVSEDEQLTPGLGRIPLLGWLFKKRSDSVDQRNLTVFITPRIIPLAGETSFEKARAALREQLSGIQVKPTETAAPTQPE